MPASGHTVGAAPHGAPGPHSKAVHFADAVAVLVDAEPVVPDDVECEELADCPPQPAKATSATRINRPEERFIALGWHQTCH
jgi:hypothetical protein